MAVERAAGGSSLIDVLDRVLDKGIVIDAWVRVSLVCIDLITVEARIVVASIDTYLKYSEAVGTVAPVAKPAHSLEAASNEALMAENAMLRARGTAEAASLRFEKVMGDSAHVSPLFITSDMARAWADLELAMAVCEIPRTAGAAPASDTVLFK